MGLLMKPQKSNQRPSAHEWGGGSIQNLAPARPLASGGFAPHKKPTRPGGPKARKVKNRPVRNPKLPPGPWFPPCGHPPIEATRQIPKTPSCGGNLPKSNSAKRGLKGLKPLPTPKLKPAQACPTGWGTYHRGIAFFHGPRAPAPSPTGQFGRAAEIAVEGSPHPTNSFWGHFTLCPGLPSGEGPGPRENVCQSLLFWSGTKNKRNNSPAPPRPRVTKHVGGKTKPVPGKFPWPWLMGKDWAFGAHAVKASNPGFLCAFPGAPESETCGFPPMSGARRGHRGNVPPLHQSAQASPLCP